MATIYITSCNGRYKMEETSADSLKKEIFRLKEEKKALERELEDQRCFLKKVNFPVIYLDSSLKVFEINEAGEKLFGSQKELRGLTCRELLERPARFCVDCPLDMVSCCEKETTDFEVTDQTPNGKVLKIACSAVVKQGNLAGYVMTCLDISRQRQLEQQVIQTRKIEALATLAGGIAHDFNNILGVILGNVDLMLYRLDFDGPMDTGDGVNVTWPEAREHFQAIRKAAVRAKDLVSQIGMFSRREQGAMQLFDIKSLVKEAVKLLRASLPTTIAIELQMDQGPAEIFGDPVQIHQIMMNLGANAAQAMEEAGGKLLVFLGEIEVTEADVREGRKVGPGKYVRLSFSDTGHGMSESMLTRIFDPFYTTRDVGRGTGMGLSVVDGIVAAHGGVVEVFSKLEEGSRFDIYLPVSRRESDGEESLLSSLRGGNESIVFVDDESDIVSVRKKMLESLGYTVYAAYGGEQALALVQRYRDEIDIVITDYTMPGMTGFQLATQLKKIGLKIPIILCTGYSDLVSVEKARKIGINKVLIKPLNIKNLASTIREVLRESV
ncbi:MAG: response regulator [Desulfobulbaceae bacterium]|nr:response regulator [Desulfobulbaceae bacterium]